MQVWLCSASLQHQKKFLIWKTSKKNEPTWYLFILLINSVDLPENIGPRMSSIWPRLVFSLLPKTICSPAMSAPCSESVSTFPSDRIIAAIIKQSTYRAFKILNWLKVWFGGAAGRRRESKGSEQSQRTCTGNESYLVTRHNVDCLTLWIAREITITIEFAVLY